MVNNWRSLWLSTLLRKLVVGSLSAWLLGASVAQAQNSSTLENTTGTVHGLSVQQPGEADEYRVLWPGHRIRVGTVESVIGDLIKVNTGELLPRFLSAKEASEKGLALLKKGDQIQLAINDQNLVVDYHLVGHELWHRILQGRLAQPLPVGQEWAVIRTEGGQEEAFSVRPLARSKVGAIPVNAPAVFLTDEANKIIDATFGNDGVLNRQTSEWKKSPPKAPYRRLEGTLLRTPGWIVIKTPEGKEQTFEVRSYLMEKLAQSPKGDSIMLMIDDENKVADVALMPHKS